MEQIPLSDEQRQKMGYLCLTQGGKAGMAYVKRIERERARKMPITTKPMAFFSKTNRTGMCIAPAFGAGRAILQRHDWISCASIGSIWPRPAGVSNRVRNVSLTNISAQFMCGKNYVVADLSRPLVVLALCGVKGEKNETAWQFGCGLRPSALMC